MWYVVEHYNKVFYDCKKCYVVGNIAARLYYFGFVEPYYTLEITII